MEQRNLSKGQKSFEDSDSEWEVSHLELYGFQQFLQSPFNLSCYIYIRMHRLLLDKALSVSQAAKSVL